MLQKKHRLHHASDIKSLLRHGRRIKVDGFFLFLKKSKDQKDSRCTVIVGKAFSPLAIERNRQKRVIRAVFQDLMKDKREGDSFDLIVMCKNKGKVLSYKDARNSILPVFKRNFGTPRGGNLTT